MDKMPTVDLSEPSWNVDEGRIWFFGPITMKNVSLAIQGIHSLNDLEDPPPIQLHMATDGGEDDPCFALYDAITLCPIPVHFYGWGGVHSAGTIIMQACKRRILTPSCTCLIHEGSSSMEGTFSNVRAEVRVEDYRAERMWEIYHNRVLEVHPEMSKEALQTAYAQDRYLTALEMVQLGLADHIATTLPV